MRAKWRELFSVVAAQSSPAGFCRRARDEVVPAHPPFHNGFSHANKGPQALDLGLLTVVRTVFELFESQRVCVMGDPDRASTILYYYFEPTFKNWHKIAVEDRERQGIAIKCGYLR